jgi:hypothetical protein
MARTSKATMVTTGKLPTKAELKGMLKEHRAGTTKGAIEERFFGITTAHGAVITSLWRSQLGEETQAQSPMSARLAKAEMTVGRLREFIDKQGLTEKLPKSLKEAS